MDDNKKRPTIKPVSSYWIRIFLTGCSPAEPVSACSDDVKVKLKAINSSIKRNNYL